MMKILILSLLVLGITGTAHAQGKIDEDSRDYDIEQLNKKNVPATKDAVLEKKEETPALSASEAACKFDAAYTPRGIEQDADKEWLLEIRKNEQVIYNQARAKLCEIGKKLKENDNQMGKNSAKFGYEAAQKQHDETEALLKSELTTKLKDLYEQERSNMKAIDKLDKPLRMKIGGLAPLQSILYVYDKEFPTGPNHPDWLHMGYTRLGKGKIKDLMKQAKNGLYEPSKFDNQDVRAIDNKDKDNLKLAQAEAYVNLSEADLSGLRTNVDTAVAQIKVNDETSRKLFEAKAIDPSKDDCSTMSKDQAEKLTDAELKGLSKECLDKLLEKFAKQPISDDALAKLKAAKAELDKPVTPVVQPRADKDKPAVALCDQAKAELAYMVLSKNPKILSEMARVAAMKMAYRVMKAQMPEKNKKWSTLEGYIKSLREAPDYKSVEKEVTALYQKSGEAQDAANAKALFESSVSKLNNKKMSYTDMSTRMDNASSSAYLLYLAKTDHDSDSALNITEADAAAVWAQQKVIEMNDKKWKNGSAERNLLSFPTQVYGLINADFYSTKSRAQMEKDATPVKIVGVTYDGNDLPVTGQIDYMGNSPFATMGQGGGLAIYKKPATPVGKPDITSQIPDADDKLAAQDLRAFKTPEALREAFVAKEKAINEQLVSAYKNASDEFKAKHKECFEKDGSVCQDPKVVGDVKGMISAIASKNPDTDEVLKEVSKKYKVSEPKAEFKNRQSYISVDVKPAE